MSKTVYDKRISFHDGITRASVAREEQLVRVACWIQTIRDEWYKKFNWFLVFPHDVRTNAVPVGNDSAI